jgi:alginate O-acetyltransferase complex protein AlgJ
MHDRIRRWRDRGVIAVFVAGLCAPWADSLAGLDPTPQPTENRSLASWPAVPTAIRDIRPASIAIADYFYDHFGFRRLLLDWHTRLRLGLGESPSPRVVLGSDGWLFYAGNQVVEDYSGQRPMPAADLDTWLRTLAERRAQLESRHTVYRFVVAPDKTTVYPEFLPASLRRGRTTLDQLVDALRQDLSRAFITLIPELRSAKSERLMYYRTDTHWTPAGLSVAATAIVTALGRQATTSATVEQVANVKGGDLARMLNGPAAFAETIYRSTPRTLQNPDGVEAHMSWRDDSLGQMVQVVTVTFTTAEGRGRVLMFGDSFGREVAPYVASHFASLVFVSMHPDDASFAAVVTRVAPEVVLEERTERYLKYPPRRVPFADRGKGWMAAE